MSFFIVLLLLIGFAIFVGVVLYNRLVALRQSRENSFSDIDVQLRQRADLVPNLVETVKGYATHEESVLKEVTEARSRVMNAPTEGIRLGAEQELGASLGKLMMVAESYPDLKANTSFIELQRELSDIENKIAASRRFYNSATREYNTAVQQFPSSLIAKQFGFREAAFYDVGANERSQLERPTQVTFKR